jgi:alanyl-tRNA synthetase
MYIYIYIYIQVIMAEEKGFSVDEEGFQKEMAAQRTRSQCVPNVFLS